MVKRALAVAAGALFATASLLAQSKPSIQGVWRPVEVTITNPNPAPGALAKGTHTNVQPGLLVFTAKHYSLIRDTGAKPRPTTGFKVAGKPTAEEMQTQWGPFQANAGTYELSGSTLTMRPTVAKNPGLQGKVPLRSAIKFDGTNLWLTLMDGPTGKIENPSTIKYVRVE